MPENNPSTYIPLATARNKLVIPKLTPGIRIMIDVENRNAPHDRKITIAWLEAGEVDSKNPTFWYRDNKIGRDINFGTLAEVVALLSRTSTVA